MLRFMTTNAWADVFGNPVPGRDSACARMIASHDPDVIAFQEFHPGWHASGLKPTLEKNGYAEVITDLGSNTLNYTPLFYRREMRLLDAGFKLFDGLNDFTSKSMTWALLEKDGRRFLSVATHFYFEENERGREARIGNARELLDLVERVAPHDPVFLGGDFNCDRFSEPLLLLQRAGLADAAAVAKEKINPVDSFHRPPKFENGVFVGPADVPGGDNDRSIDHVFVRRGTTVTRYTLDISVDARSYSDHCPLVIDAEL